VLKRKRERHIDWIWLTIYTVEDCSFKVSSSFEFWKLQYDFTVPRALLPQEIK